MVSGCALTRYVPFSSSSLACWPVEEKEVPELVQLSSALAATQPMTAFIYVLQTERLLGLPCLACPLAKLMHGKLMQHWKAS